MKTIDGINIIPNHFVPENSYVPAPACFGNAVLMNPKTIEKLRRELPDQDLEWSFAE